MGRGSIFQIIFRKGEIIMKLREKALIGLMALSLAGGIATTFALTSNGGSGSTSGSVDAAIYLNWGDTTQVGDISGLKNGAYIYKSIGVAAPIKSSNVTDKQGQLTFTLAAQVGDNYTINGTTVYISTNDLENVTDHSASAWKDATKLDKSNLTGSFKFNADTTYYLAFTKTAEELEEGKVVSATLTMSLSVVDAN